MMEKGLSVKSGGSFYVRMEIFNNLMYNDV